jgi:predicted nicotinamide N-methyase
MIVIERQRRRRDATFCLEATLLLVYKMKMWLLMLFLAKASLALEVSGAKVHQVPLRRTGAASPYCLAVSSPMDILDRPGTNFLATQVWPSARTAAIYLERFFDRLPNKDFSVCEFGCGPGLPSLAAAFAGAKKVYATDLDTFALGLVMKAAQDQNLSERLEAMPFDLINGELDDVPKADLYVFSDVFESASVAKGAARVSERVLQQGSRVWVFAQSDRAQREVYLQEMRTLLQDSSLSWRPTDESIPEHDVKLWLCDIDETTVQYG